MLSFTLLLVVYNVNFSKFQRDLTMRNNKNYTLLTNIKFKSNITLYRLVNNNSIFARQLLGKF